MKTVERLTPQRPVGARFAEGLAWVEANAVGIRRVLLRDGAVLLSELGCADAESFERLMGTLFPVLSDYVGGTSPREVIRSKIMTATRTPDDWSIIPHQEMAYTASPPDVIGFFCAEPAAAGGASTLTDMRRAAQDLDPEVVARVVRHGLQLRRTLPPASRMHLKPGVQKPWEEVFGTASRSDAEDIASRKGWRIEWRGEDMMLWQELVAPLRSHRVNGDAVWCNQMHFFNPATMIAWAEADGRTRDAAVLREAEAAHPDLLDRMYLGDGAPVPDADALHVLQVLQRHETPLQLRAGDILILDNLYVAHGRTAFSGRRDLQVALAQYSEEFP